MSNLRIAVLGWIIPSVMLLLVGLLSYLDQTVPYPEPMGEPPPCYVDEHDETICPEQQLAPESTLRKVVSALAVEWLTSLFTVTAVGAGLGLSIAAVARTRKTRRENAQDKTAFRVAISALVLLTVIPMCLGLLALVLIASFPIRG